MRGFVAVAGLALAVAGCGGSSSTTPAPMPASPATAVRAWYGAIERGDADTACALLSDHGRRAIESGSKKACSTLFASAHHTGAGKVIKAGTQRDVALVVTAGEEAGVDKVVVVLRRIGGRWLVDLPSTPVLDALDARGVPAIDREALPTGGAQRQSVLGAAGRYVDEQASSHGAAVHVATAAVVGDVAIAYLLPGSDVPGARPTPATYGTLTLVRGPNGWRPLGGTRLSTPR